MKDYVLVLTNDEDKICTRCGRRLHPHDFYRKDEASDKMQSWCKECQREYKRERRAKVEVDNCTRSLNLSEILVRGRESDDLIKLRSLLRATQKVERIIESRITRVKTQKSTKRHNK